MARNLDRQSAQVIFRVKMREYFEEVELRRKARAAGLDPDTCTQAQVKASGLPKVPKMKSLMPDLAREVSEYARQAGTEWQPPEDQG